MNNFSKWKIGLGGVALMAMLPCAYVMVNKPAPAPEVEEVAMSTTETEVDSVCPMEPLEARVEEKTTPKQKAKKTVRARRPRSYDDDYESYLDGLLTSDDDLYGGSYMDDLLADGDDWDDDLYGF